MAIMGAMTMGLTDQSQSFSLVSLHAFLDSVAIVLQQTLLLIISSCSSCQFFAVKSVSLKTIQDNFFNYNLVYFGDCILFCIVHQFFNDILVNLCR